MINQSHHLDKIFFPSLITHILLCSCADQISSSSRLKTSYTRMNSLRSSSADYRLQGPLPPQHYIKEFQFRVDPYNPLDYNPSMRASSLHTWSHFYVGTISQSYLFISVPCCSFFSHQLFPDQVIYGDKRLDAINPW